MTFGYTIKPVVWNLTAPTSVTFDDKSNMYIAEEGYPFTNIPKVPRILQVSPDGIRLYFSIGIATNSGVVGLDNYDNQWLSIAPDGYNIPDKIITLSGQKFTTLNHLTSEPSDIVTTGAFVPFNTTINENHVVKGKVKCKGCILSANLDGTDLRLEG